MALRGHAEGNPGASCAVWGAILGDLKPYWKHPVRSETPRTGVAPFWHILAQIGIGIGTVAKQHPYKQ
eukprot:9203480-Pyramimonas_sp.AAC.1